MSQQDLRTALAPINELHPSISPSLISTFNPTSDPTIDLPYFAVKAEQSVNESNIDSLQSLCQLLVIVIVAISSFIILIAKIDASFIHINDYLAITPLIIALIYILNIFSDCFFIAYLDIVNRNNPSNSTILMIATICIIFSILFGFIQLFVYKRNNWSIGNIHSWTSKNGILFLILSFIFGNVFAACLILNSFIFRMQIFDMGLSNEKLYKFVCKGLTIIAIIRNIPLLSMQIYYTVSNDNQDANTTMAIIFSISTILLAIFISVMILIPKNKKLGAVFSMDITMTGEVINMAQDIDKCITMKQSLQHALANLFEVNDDFINITKPTRISNGLSLQFEVYIQKHDNATNANTYHKHDNPGELLERTLKEYNGRGELSNILKQSWKLSNDPKVSNIERIIIGNDGQKTLVNIHSNSDMTEMTNMKIKNKADEGIENKQFGREIKQEQNGIEKDMKQMNEIVELYKVEGIGVADKTNENVSENTEKSNAKNRQQPIIETAGPLQDMERIGSTQM